MAKIRKGDEVIVLVGKNRDKRGTVLRVDSNDKVLVEGVNIVKKHIKANPQQGTSGGIVEQERPLHISNVAIFNPVTGKADRIGYKVLEDGRKVRLFKSNKEVVDV